MNTFNKFYEINILLFEKDNASKIVFSEVEEHTIINKNEVTFKELIEVFYKEPNDRNIHIHIKYKGYNRLYIFTVLEQNHVRLPIEQIITNIVLRTVEQMSLELNIPSSDIKNMKQSLEYLEIKEN